MAFCCRRFSQPATTASHDCADMRSITAGVYHRPGFALPVVRPSGGTLRVLRPLRGLEVVPQKFVADFEVQK
jgi:hypothetical protein